VRFTIAHPWPPFLSTLAIAKGPFVVSPSAVQKNAKGDDLGQEFLRGNAVGTGPYRLQSWEPGQQVVLVKNDAYWRGWAGAHVDRVVVRYVKEYTTRRQLLLRGDVDLIDAVWVPLWAMKVATPMRKWVKGFTFNPIYMAWTGFYDLSVDR
jgi:peptide/nickel transport system substrate-binding protein